jgi:diguanylate cyclase (GGDEF)-like protein/PAS domain S-box-containing protein
MAVVEDVTSAVEHERTLLGDRQRFRAIFENVRDCAIYTITLDGLVEEWNKTLQRFGDWRPADVEGRHIGMFFPHDDPSARSPDALLAEARRAGSVETEGWRLRRDGSSRWAHMVITALPDDRGAVSGFVVVTRDMTERKRLEDHLQQLATVDPLTGAFNRRYGQATLNTEFERRKRMGLPFAVMMLDIDLFKAINDDYGHEAGDAVLCAMVRACTAELRVLDVLARWGGDEFVFVLPGATSEGAVATAERLRERLAALRVPVGREGNTRFTVSIGIAVPSSDDDTAGLLVRADQALYSAKNSGRNQVVLAA